ncbi:hypothetical protein HG530_005264 [Fusarium avenaceum]|nr:hypothetical protein HG530_005264 [Fusarium avenaceum]
MTRIKIISNGAFEECCILWNDSQSSAQVKQADRRCINIINTNMARHRFDQAEQRKSEGRLASSGATNDANLLMRLDVEADVLENQIQALPVAGAVANNTGAEGDVTRNSDYGKASGRQDDDSTNRLEANGKPAVCADGREVSAEISIHAPFVLKLESLLLSYGSSRGQKVVLSPRESIQDTSGGCSVKEGHGRAEDGVGHTLVKLPRRLAQKNPENQGLNNSKSGSSNANSEVDSDILANASLRSEKHEQIQSDSVDVVHLSVLAIDGPLDLALLQVLLGLLGLGRTTNLLIDTSSFKKTSGSKNVVDDVTTNMRINSRKNVIKKVDVGTGIDSTSQRNTRFLTTTERDTSFADDGLISVGKLRKIVYYVVDVSEGGLVLMAIPGECTVADNDALLAKLLRGILDGDGVGLELFGSEKASQTSNGDRSFDNRCDDHRKNGKRERQEVEQGQRREDDISGKRLILGQDEDSKG